MQKKYTPDPQKISADPQIKLVIGLGNPGPEYENTYHNAGFLFIDFLMKNPRNLKFDPPAKTSAQAGIRSLKFLKSGAYMNMSGGFVQKAMKKYKTAPEELLVIQDDSDITLGNFKFSFGRGAAGHKGMGSIMAALKTKSFWRVRIGIRPPVSSVPVGGPLIRRSPGDGNRFRWGGKAEGFVLKKISARDRKTLDGVFEKISEWLCGKNAH